MRLRSRTMVGVLLALLLAATLPFGFYQYQSHQAGNELAKLLAELDRTAGPWRLDDIMARRPFIPDERNAATLIKKARLSSPYKVMPVVSDFKLAPNQIMDPQQLVKLREYLDHYDENIRAARQLVDFPQGNFPIAVTRDVISTPIPHVDSLYGLRTALQHDIWWQLQQANFEQAAQSCHAAVNAVGTLRDDPFLICHMVRQAALREVAGSLERMLAQGQPPAKLLPPLQNLLLDEADFDAWTPALEGERAGMHQLFELMAAQKVDMRFLRGMMKGGPISWRDRIDDYIGSPKVPQSHAWLVRQLTDVLAAAKLPPRERMARLQELQKRIDDAPDLARMLALPVSKSSYPVFLRTDARLRCAAAGLAAEHYRQKNDGRWPKALDELVPAFLAKMPLDPYTGDPLQMRATPYGLVIYSAGPDGAWRGTARDEPELPENDARIDHEFRLWNVNQRRQEKK